MERVDADSDFEEDGFESAISITQEEAQSVILSRVKEKEVVAFGEENGAIIDQGAGEMILLQIPSGSQYAFPVIELSDSLSDVC